MNDAIFDPIVASGDWAHLPYSSERVPAPDLATANLARLALQALTATERDVVELLYGFRGSVKSEQEVAALKQRARQTIHTQHQAALAKMREALLV